MHANCLHWTLYSLVCASMVAMTASGSTSIDVSDATPFMDRHWFEHRVHVDEDFTFDGRHSDFAQQLFRRFLAGDVVDPMDVHALPDAAHTRLRSLLHASSATAAAAATSSTSFTFRDTATAASKDTTDSTSTNANSSDYTATRALFTSLSPLLQRALLWDAGVVSAGISLGFAQIYTRCGLRMSELAVSLNQFRAHGCTEQACATPNGERFHQSRFCDGYQMGNASVCATTKGKTPVHSSMWSDGGHDATLPDPELARHEWNAWNDTTIQFTIFGIHLRGDPNAYGVCSLPSMTVPCIDYTAQDPADWCLPVGSKLVSLWFEAEREFLSATGMTTMTEALSTSPGVAVGVRGAASAPLLVLVLAVVVGVVGFIVCFCYCGWCVCRGRGRASSPTTTKADIYNGNPDMRWLRLGPWCAVGCLRGRARRWKTRQRGHRFGDDVEEMAQQQQQQPQQSGTKAFFVTNHSARDGVSVVTTANGANKGVSLAALNHQQHHQQHQQHQLTSQELEFSMSRGPALTANQLDDLGALAPLTQSLGRGAFLDGSFHHYDQEFADDDAQHEHSDTNTRSDLAATMQQHMKSIGSMSSSGSLASSASASTGSSAYSSRVTRTLEQAQAEGSMLAELLNDPLAMRKRVPYVDVSVARLVSKGAFGEIWIGRQRDQLVAVKRLVPERRGNLKELAMFASEITLMAQLTHRNIVPLTGVAWNTPENLCITMEYMENGDLQHLLETRDRHRLPWRDAPDGDDNDVDDDYGGGCGSGGTGDDPQCVDKEGSRTFKARLALDIAQGLQYLHAREPQVVHRDLKSKNVLLGQGFVAKLCDFGVSRSMDAEHLATMTCGVGTAFWTAPEVLVGDSYTESADVYSFGVVLSELDTHELPFFDAVDAASGKRMETIRIMHLVCLGQLTPTLTPACPSEIRALALECMRLEPEARPTMQQIATRLQVFLQRVPTSPAEQHPLLANVEGTGALLEVMRADLESLADGDEDEDGDASSMAVTCVVESEATDNDLCEVEDMTVALGTLQTTQAQSPVDDDQTLATQIEDGDVSSVDR